MLGIWGVATVTAGDDGVEELAEELVGLLVTSDGTDGLDHWVTGVVNTSLDAVTEVNAQLGLLGLELLVEAWVGLDDLGEEGGVVGKVGKLVGHGTGQEGGVLLGAVVLGIATTELDPLWEILNGGSESVWWVVRHVP